MFNRMVNYVCTHPHPAKQSASYKVDCFQGIFSDAHFIEGGSFHET